MKFTKLAFSILIILLVYCCSNSVTNKENEDQPLLINDKPVEVKAFCLDYSDFNYELISNGVIASKNKANIHFQSQDVILKIYVKNGEQVVKGQKLAELDRFKLKAALIQAQDVLFRARLDFQDVLIGQGYALADSSKVPDAILKIAKIRSGYDQAQNNYTLAKYNYDSAILYAPFNGLIANLNSKEYNQPGAEPFCTLVDNKEVEIVFNILESELPLVKLNDKVIISPFSQAEFKVDGRISELNPIVDKNGMVKVKAVLINQSNKLLEGMNVLVKIQRLLNKRLIIPKSALVLRSNKKVVFTLKNNRANWVYVQIGQENSNSYVVTEGLNPKDSVIYEGCVNLAHETPVVVK